MGKHLNLSQRIEIEQKLNEGKSFRQIAGIIGKPHTTVSREILTRRIFQKGNSFNSLNMKCKKLEKNHEFIRYVLPKKTTFKDLTQNDCLIIANHINSLCGDSLNYNCPFKAMLFLCVED